MNFVADDNTLVHYYGDEEPTPGFARHLLFDTSHQIIAVDVETISLKDRTPLGFSIALNPNQAFYFQLFPEESPAIPWHLLKDPKITKIYHNPLFDLLAMREYDIDYENIIDTNTMSRLLGNKYNGLMDLSWVHKKEVHECSEFMPKGGTNLDSPIDKLAKLCCEHTMATFQLFLEFIDKVDIDYLMTEMKLIPICVEMSNRGILIDQERRAYVQEVLEEEVERYKLMCSEFGFNPGSPQQVAYMLAKRGAYNHFHRLPFTKDKYGKRTTNLSTDVSVLKTMDDPIASIVLDYRQYSKLLGTYIKPWAREERASTRFHLDAITGRPSSTDRNMQNIPGKYRKDGTEYPVDCRSLLIPDTGTWSDADWEQLEPRTLAYLSGDREMQYIFSLPKFNPDGTKNLEADIHGQVAQFMGIPRKLGKTINLAMTYGATIETLMEQSGIRNRNHVVNLKKMWGQKFPQAMDWIEGRQEDALRTGVAVTIFGRKIRLPTLDEDSADGIARKAVDYPCQGSAAEILKRGLIRMRKFDLALQVHDQLLIDGYVPRHQYECLEEGLAPFRTPMEVKYLTRWA